MSECSLLLFWVYSPEISVSPQTLSATCDKYLLPLFVCVSNTFCGKHDILPKKSRREDFAGDEKEVFSLIIYFY